MSILYHASSIEGIVELEPRISNHGTPQVYFSAKRENVFVYLSNAIEKYCKEKGFQHNGPWTKWGPYGFGADGKLYIDEYYPDALKDTYMGVKGYIYSVMNNATINPMEDIPFAFTSTMPVLTVDCEYVDDAYQTILSAEKAGIIRVNRYSTHSEKKILWIQKTILEEYRNCETSSDYKFFIEGKFGNILQ